MRSVMVLNAKGGCGKTTIATNLASHYANEDKSVVLADFDPQAGSMDWLASRPSLSPKIIGLDGSVDGLKHLPRNADILIIDAPARLHGAELTAMVHHAQTIILPVMPSPVDINAAERFLAELSATPVVSSGKVRVGLVANRVQEHTRIASILDAWMARRRRRLSYLGFLRETQNYVKAFERGLGIFELPPYQAWQDWAQWEPILSWLESRRSLPNS